MDDIKERINALSETEAKAALAWTITQIAVNESVCAKEIPKLEKTVLNKALNGRADDGYN